MTPASMKRKLKDGTIVFAPTVRAVQSVGKTWSDRYVVELTNDYLLLRPRRCTRTGPAACTISWGSLMQHLMFLKLEERKREQARRRKLRRRGKVGAR